MNAKIRTFILIVLGLLALAIVAIGISCLASLLDNGNAGGPSAIVTGTAPPQSPETSEEPEDQWERTEAPIASPSAEPTAEPTGEPIGEPTEKPTVEPSEKPSEPSADHEGGLDGGVIRVGQQLVIPAAGSAAAEESAVVDSGVLPSDEKQIALTFDAGWLFDQTTDILDVLDDCGVKATFFLRGKWVEDHPELAKEISLRGHRVENHSLTHGHMTEMTDEEVQNEIDTTTRIIEEVTGYRPYLFRPPFGEYDSRILNVLGTLGYPYTVKWTIDSLDWLEEYNGEAVTEAFLTERILSNATDGGIVLMHIGGFRTVRALPDIIKGLQEDGYKLVRVNDMLPGPPRETAATVYTVKQGDTLYGIARQFGVSVEDILDANP